MWWVATGQHRLPHGWWKKKRTLKDADKILKELYIEPLRKYFELETRNDILPKRAPYENTYPRKH